jgi:3-oxoacyl-[acyl-carrier protein] reductase
VDLGLKGRRALVTAASKGLGLACAQALADEGARVFITSRDPAAIEAAAKRVGAAGWRAGDVAVPGEPEAAIHAAVDILGGLDIVVANAGGPPPGTFQSTPLDGWDKAYQLTLMSAVRTARAALPHLKQSGQGRIVFLTSITVRQPIPNLVLSNSLRAAVTGLSKTLAGELGPNGITVNCIAPGTILTDRIRELYGGGGANLEESVKSAAAEVPMRRIGTPAEFGALCAFLCSEHAGYITGQTIGIDGGALVGAH